MKMGKMFSADVVDVVALTQAQSNIVDKIEDTALRGKQRGGDSSCLSCRWPVSQAK